jgi:hypothetical protein
MAAHEGRAFLPQAVGVEVLPVKEHFTRGVGHILIAFQIALALAWSRAQIWGIFFWPGNRTVRAKTR